MCSGPASGSARTRTTPSLSRNLAVSAAASSGVTSNALATRTHGVSAGERRSEQGDGQCPDAGDAGVREMLLVDLPVVERHARSRRPGSGRPPRPLRVRAPNRLTPEGGGQVVDAGGSQAAAPSGSSIARRAAPPSPRAGRRRRRRLAGLALAGWPAQRSRLPSADVAPRSSIAASMSTLRLENARSTAFGYVSQLAQAVAPDVPGEAERCELGPQRGAVEGAGGHLPGEEVSPVGGGPATVGALDQVGDDDMGVELGVAGPAGAVPERRADEPLGFDQLRRRRGLGGRSRLLWRGGRARRRPPGRGRPRSCHGPPRIRRPRAKRRPWGRRTSGRSRGGGLAGPGGPRSSPSPTSRRAGSAALRLRPGRRARALRRWLRSTVPVPRPGRGSSRRRCWRPCRGSSRLRRRRRAALSTASRRASNGCVGDRSIVESSGTDVTLNVTLVEMGHLNRENVLRMERVYARRAAGLVRVHRCGADDPCVVEQRGSHSDAAGAGSMPDRSL